MAENQDQKESKKPKRPLNIVLIAQIIFAVLNVSAVGGGAYLVYISTMGWDTPSLTEDRLVEQRNKELHESSSVGPLIYTMDKFTANLTGDPLKDPKRTIQLEVNLEMLNKEGFEEVMNGDNRAKARDKILQILESRSYNEVETIQGKLFLKNEIASEVTNILDKGIVKDVYFTSFVVQ